MSVDSTIGGKVTLPPHPPPAGYGEGQRRSSTGATTSIGSLLLGQSVTRCDRDPCVPVVISVREEDKGMCEIAALLMTVRSGEYGSSEHQPPSM